MIGLIALLAAAAQPVPYEVTEVCKVAIESSHRSTDPSTMQELYVGRLEIEMREREFDEDLRKMTTIVCRAYHQGYIGGMEKAVKILQAGETKTAQR